MTDTEWDFDPESYLAMVRAEIRGYDALQDTLVAATADRRATSILELGSGTGVTARRTLDTHRGATLLGVDGSEAMLRHARRLVPEATFCVARLEDPLPAGPFDLVISAFAVHHLPGLAKAALFGRIAGVLEPGGRFALLDVVATTETVDQPVPLDPGVDVPSSLGEQLTWLRHAGLHPTVVLADGDLAVVTADAG